MRRFPLVALLAAAPLFSCKKSLPEEVDFFASRQGAAVGFADFSGDGVADKLVGAPNALHAGRLGVVLVYPAKNDGFATEPAWVLSGDEGLGAAIASVGDVDQDGKADCAVSAWLGDGEDSALAGTVTVYRGGQREPTVLKKVSGTLPMSRFGLALAGGDLNADGVSDLVVAAPMHSPSSAFYQSGAVFVFFGPDLSTSAYLPATATNKGLGQAVAVGELNGDGVADLVVAASGRVLGYFGGPGFQPSTDAPDLLLKSVASGFGKSLALPGDLDGDGAPELVVGAPNATVGGKRDTGSVYLVRVKGAAKSIDLSVTPAPSELIVRLDGPGLFARLGGALASLGDIDGDGRADLAMGAPQADVDDKSMAGRVLVLRGKDVGPTTTLATTTGFAGSKTDQGYGAALAAGSSGLLLIGAPRGKTGSGAVWMVNVLTGEVVASGSTGGPDEHDHHETDDHNH